MKLHSISIHNFRLLSDVKLSLEEAITVIVGRNNSGKTSLIELLYKLIFLRTLADAPRFTLEDFSLKACEGFWEAFTMMKNGKDAAEVRASIPNIVVGLDIEYDITQPNLGTLSNFIIDLNPNSNRVNIEIKYELEEGKVDMLLDASGVKVGDEKISFYKQLKGRIQKYFIIKIEAVDPNDNENRKNVSLTELKEMLLVNFISAQRPLDSDTSKESNALGRVLENIFNAKKADQAVIDDKQTIESLNAAVESVQSSIDGDFKKAVEALLPSLSKFGYPGLNDSVITAETVLDVERLLKDSTKVYYQGIEGINLPEKNNGLGTRNLIYILFKIYEAFKQFQVLPKAPALQIIFIEEPEAHLHPQMSEVFISQLEKLKQVFIDTYNSGEPWPVQFVVTTHSSHIANRAKFRSIRYFIAKHDGDKKTEIKDLREGLTNSGIEDDEKFLHKYLELTRCDLFFADKAILIEGQSERLLLPKMIEKVSKKLSSQYISTIEVGGAHAHIFFDFLKFLEIKTLIVTDIDSVNDNGTKCPVNVGKSTSNSCLKKWFDNPQSPPELTSEFLLSKTSAEKTDGQLRLAYEIPNSEPGSGCGRSFEEAFIRTNPSLFDDGDPYQIASTESNNKADFALRFALGDEDWKTPLYIKEGLLWLAENPSDQVINEAPVSISENSHVKSQ